MADSPTNPHRQIENPCRKTGENDEEIEITKPHERICDFCGESRALLYCKADSARLCLACDREIHSANQLFSKHTRSLLCDSCDSSPASVLCCSENRVLCQNCDWENHGRSISSVHDRTVVEGFTGCPSVSEMGFIIGIEDLGNKGMFGSDESDDWLVDCGDNGYEDFSVWETPSIFSVDDLVASNSSIHNFQAIGVPPLPKNRNDMCGEHKEEICRQLRELAKGETRLSFGHGDGETLIGFEPIVPAEQNIQTRNMFRTDYEQPNAEPVVFSAYKENEHQWRSDSGDPTNEFLLPCTKIGSYIEESRLVPDKHSEISGNATHASGTHEGHVQLSVLADGTSVPQKFASNEFMSQCRDSALSRYKEKKKTRRYDKHIRYESRKVRAESRIRVRGRFAKMNQ